MVGYTNAGKSTTFNTILRHSKIKNEKEVMEKDMLFATLGTSVRNIKLPNNQEILLIDTVGFVSKLPTSLVNSFRSTLEEIINSSLIIHVDLKEFTKLVGNFETNPTVSINNIS